MRKEKFILNRVPYETNEPLRYRGLRINNVTGTTRVNVAYAYKASRPKIRLMIYSRETRR